MGVRLIDRYEGFLQTPPLWVKEQFGLEQFAFPKVAVATLPLSQIPERIRLGHQMEFIFRECITHTPGYTVALHNAALRASGITIGEIDFIIHDEKQNHLLHVELTYKFYIIDPEISEPIHRLMGPNRRDMFFTKLDKIKEEQLNLLSTSEGQALLEKHNLLDQEIIPQVCFKAQLFVPYGADRAHIRPLNTDCVSGYWLRFNEFNSRAFKDDLYYIPFKQEWPSNPIDSVSWITHYEVLLELAVRMVKENAPMVWRKKSDTTLEKFFVVWW